MSSHNEESPPLRFTTKVLELPKLHIDDLPTPKSVKQKKGQTLKQPIAQTMNLNLNNMTGCVSSGMLFLFGGHNPNIGKDYSQLIAYNLNNKQWTDIRQIYYNSYTAQVFPPAMTNAIIFPFNSWMIIIYAADRSDFFYGIHVHGTYYSLSKYYVIPNSKIRETFYHSHSVVQQTIWIFGGRKGCENGGSSNQLIRCDITEKTFVYGHNQQNYFEMERTLIPEDGTFPSPRHSHAQCTVGTSFYIFGGCHSSQYLNDLYRYDTLGNVWTPIVLTMVPPPMKDHTISSCSERYIYVVGGEIMEEVDHPTQNNLLYRYDAYKMEFTVVQAGLQAENGKDLQTVVTRTQHVSIGDMNRLFLIGGMNSTGPVVLSELDEDKDNTCHTLEYLKKGFERQFEGEKSDYDVILKTKGSEYIRCHKCILSARSKFFKESLSNVSQYNEEGIPVLEIGEYHFDTIKTYLKFIYCGDLMIDEELDIAEDCLKELIQISLLEEDKFNVVSKMCNRERLYLNSCFYVFLRMKQDFCQLYETVRESLDNVIPEACPENYFADTTVQLVDPTTGHILHEVRAHRFVLCKSSYIKAIFQSGMEESKTGIVKFTEISLDGLLCVLKYLYYGDIKIQVENVVEVFVCSLLFQIGGLANYCRSIVVENINEENVVDISVVVDLYSDDSLKEHCVKFIVLNYEKLSQTEAFKSHLPQGMKSEVTLKYLDKEKRQRKKR